MYVDTKPIRIYESLEINNGVIFSTTDDQEPETQRFYFCTVSGVSTHSSIQDVFECLNHSTRGFEGKLKTEAEAIPLAQELLQARNCQHKEYLSTLIRDWE